MRVHRDSHADFALSTTIQQCNNHRKTQSLTADITSHTVLEEVKVERYE